MSCTGCGEGTGRLSAEGRNPRAAELFCHVDSLFVSFSVRIFYSFIIFSFLFWLLADSFLVAEGDAFSLCQACFRVTLRRRCGPGSSRSICRRCGSGRAQRPRSSQCRQPFGALGWVCTSCCAGSPKGVQVPLHLPSGTRVQ